MAENTTAIYTNSTYWNYERYSGCKEIYKVYYIYL